MREHRWDITAAIEPGQTECRIDGTALQHVSVILSDSPPDDPGVDWAPAVMATLRPNQARELAFCLLELAEQAEQASER